MSAPPFPYFGGKQLLGPRIVGAFPAHRHYVEPFAGSLAVLLAKPRSAFETVNDLDGDIMAFWRALREQPDDLARLCALTPHSRTEHELSYDRDDCSDLERARRVWVCLTQGRGATLKATGWRQYVKPAGTTSLPDYLAGYVARIPAAAERLKLVSLECRPALDIIIRYGAEPDVLLYVDPPYLGESRGAGDRGRYQVDMLGSDCHTELLAALQACRSAVVLSGYPSQLYDEQLGDWHRTEFATGTGQSAAGEWSTRTEVLWSNRPIGDQPSLWEAS